jgi:hypothetical protein
MRTSLPIRIRVNLVNGESVHLASPILEAGTALVGRVRTQNSSVFHRVPLQEVESLEWPEVGGARGSGGGCRLRGLGHDPRLAAAGGLEYRGSRRLGSRVIVP